MLSSARPPTGEIGANRGLELYVTAGTTSGTTIVAELNPGPTGSQPDQFVRNGSRVFFTSDSAASGREPWVMSTDTIDAALADSYGTGCPGTGGLVPRAISTAAPVLGVANAVELQDAAPNAVAIAAFGLRGAIDAGFGCTLLVDPIVTQLQVLTDATGQAAVPFTIPNVPVVLHFELNMQPLVLDPLGAWFGIVNFGSGLSLRFGR